MGLLDLVTGGKSGDASAAMEQALQDIQNVKTPTADEMKFKLQQLVQAGVLTPDQARTYLQQATTMGQGIDQTGTAAEKTSIADLLGAANEGGLNPAEQAKIGEIERQLGTQEKGANDAVVQRQAERGALTGGETMAAQLANNQNATANANELGLGTASEGYNAMLNELTSAGTMGGQLQGQENTQSNTVAAAVDAINKFNAAQQQGEENLNVGNKNAAQQFNLENEQNISNTNVGNENTHAQYEAQLPQQVFGDEMQKAAAEAGVSENQANLDTAQGGQLAGLYGSLLGTAGEAATAGMSKAPVTNINTATYAEGGEVPSEIHNYLNGGMVDGKAQVPGNSPKNDTVPAMLSPGEIVLPRTVAHNPEPDKVMEFLRRIRQNREPAPVHPADIHSVLEGLSLRRAS